jgi:hypothetical protein
LSRAQSISARFVRSRRTNQIRSLNLIREFLGGSGLSDGTETRPLGSNSDLAELRLFGYAAGFPMSREIFAIVTRAHA